MSSAVDNSDYDISADDFYTFGNNVRPKRDYDYLSLTIVDVKGRATDVTVPIINGSIEVSVGDRDIKALVDTGASFSFINEDYFKRLKSELGKLYIRPCNMAIKIADDSRVVSRECVGLSFRIFGKHFRAMFYVVKDLSHPLILGVQFLRIYYARLTMGGKSDSDEITRPPALSTLSNLRIYILYPIWTDVAR